MPPVGFEPTISAGERLQTNAFDRAADGTGHPIHCCRKLQGEQPQLITELCQDTLFWLVVVF